MALPARIPLHHICPPNHFWIPTMGASEIAHFKHPHPRYPKTLFLADLMQRYAPRQNFTFFGIAHVQHTHPSYPETPFLAHLFWPLVCRGMGVWGTTPEPKKYFFGSLEVIWPLSPLAPKCPDSQALIGGRGGLEKGLEPPTPIFFLHTNMLAYQ